MADTKFFLTLILSVFLITVPIALIVQSYNDWNANTTSNYSATTCPEGMAYCPNMQKIGSSARLSGNVSMAETNYLNTSVLIEDYSWRYVEGVGTMFRTSKIEVYDHYLLINGIQPDTNGYYTTSYLINNSVKGDFKLVLWGKRTATGLVLEVSDDEFRIPSAVPYLYSYRFPYPGLFDTHSMLYIRTRYSPALNKLSVSLDNTTLFSIDTTRPVFYTIFDSSNYYGGIGTKTDKVTLVSYYPENGQVISGGTKSLTVLDDIWKIVPYHEQIEDFVDVLGAILNPFNNYGTDLTGTKIIPWWLSTLIDIMLIGIIAYGIQILRGD